MPTPKTARIYLDYHATTPADPRVVAAMSPYWTELFGNPHSSDHSFGWQAHEATETSRAQVASLVGADPDEIIFTSGATESNNLAILGMARAMRPNRRRIIVSAIEHKCVLAAAAAAGNEGFEVAVAPVNRYGFIEPDVIETLLDDNTALVSIMAVNNEIGTIQPLHEISQLCHKVGAIFHSDAAQALTAEEIDVEELGIDLMSLSAHKAYAPKGIGALYIRRDLDVKPHPLLHGGGQESGFRAGTLPTPLCVGFGNACSILEAEGSSEFIKIAGLRDNFLSALQSNNIAFSVNGADQPRHPGNLNITFFGIDANLLISSIQPMVAASTGSACSSGIPSTSHVLRAINLSTQDINSSIRFGIGRFTTKDNILTAVQILCDEIKRIKNFS